MVSLSLASVDKDIIHREMSSDIVQVCWLILQCTCCYVTGFFGPMGTMSCSVYQSMPENNTSFAWPSDCSLFPPGPAFRALNTHAIVVDHQGLPPAQQVFMHIQLYRTSSSIKILIQRYANEDSDLSMLTRNLLRNRALRLLKSCTNTHAWQNI